MSTINVISRTQRIIVDPATRSVSVINAGPRGPAGPMGTGLTIEGSGTYAHITEFVTPILGHIWLVTNTAGGAIPGDGLLWDGTSWINIGQIRGPMGLTGLDSIVPGPPGDPGPNVPQFAQATAPVANVTGDQWFNTNTGRQYVWYDGFWVEVGTSFQGNILTIDGQLLTRAGGVLAPINRASLAADGAFSSLYAPVNRGIHSLTTAFSTTGTHTTLQDEGLTKTVNDIIGRRLKFSLVVQPYAPGGINTVIYKLLRDGVILRQWDISGLTNTTPCGMTLTHTELVAVNHAGSVYKVQIAGGGNLQVSSFGDAARPRQLIIEDIGT